MMVEFNLGQEKGDTNRKAKGKAERFKDSYPNCRILVVVLAHCDEAEEYIVMEEGFGSPLNKVSHVVSMILNALSLTSSHLSGVEIVRGWSTGLALDVGWKREG